MPWDQYFGLLGAIMLGVSIVAPSTPETRQGENLAFCFFLAALIAFLGDY
ncbi:hypothetical protein KAR91_51890 [Candidatus Pacearchaeota archaeon]|nr:hypothetical protein [Candidatus Pacearchaeota archaeon]